MQNISFQWKSPSESEPVCHTPAADSPDVISLHSPGAGYCLEFTWPVDGIAGIWTPYGDRATMQKVSWHGELIGGPCLRPSLLSFVDAELGNLLALAAGPCSDEISITWDLDQASACYHVRVSWPDAPATASRQVWISTKPGAVHSVVPELLDAEAPALPAVNASHLFEPSFCTWYAYHGALDQQTAGICAERVRALGFGTFIMDDGWAYNVKQRVGAKLGPWHRYNGDFLPAPMKFPAFAEHVAAVQGLGLRYLLWVAPFVIGRRTVAYQRLRSHLLNSWLHEGFQVADPRCEVAVSYIEESLAYLLRTFHVDGFKVDYDYALPAVTQRQSGTAAAYAAATRRIIRTLQQIDPGVEYNLPVNAFARTVTNAYRCVDVPFDPDSNRLFMANLSLLSGQGALYSDPALWSVNEPVTAVHRHMVPSLFIVPSVGAPVMELPPDHQDALRAWLSFYRRHQAVLNRGLLARTWAAGDFQHFSRRLGDRQVIAAFSRYPVEIPTLAETFLINGSGDYRMTVKVAHAHQAVVENAGGAVLEKPMSLTAGLHEISCPSGSILHLTT